MERKIGEIFEYTKDGESVKLKVKHTKLSVYCDDCYFNNINTHCYYRDISITGSCFSLTRSDKKHVIFKLVNMCETKEEKRNVELTIKKAKEWYNKGGELKDVALQAFRESELRDNRSHTWEEFCRTHNQPEEGQYWYIDIDSKIDYIGNGFEMDENADRNLYPTKKYAEAARALAQLLMLRQEWIGDWEPDWYSHNNKFVINNFKNSLNIDAYSSTTFIMSFPSKTMADEFLNDFKDLLEIAKPLL